LQNEYSKKNEEAWNQMAYDAWVNRFGEPYNAAEKIKKIRKIGFQICIHI